MLSFRSLLAVVTLVAGLLVVGCSHAPKPSRPAGPGIGGTVIYITNATLPADATVEVRLVELNREGRVEREVTSTSYPRPAAMPLEFWLPYQAGLIDQHQSYGLEAKITSNGRILFTTTRPIPVLTKGNPKNVEAVVVPAQR